MPVSEKHKKCARGRTFSINIFMQKAQYNPSRNYHTVPSVSAGNCPIGITPNEYNINLFRAPARKLSPEEMDSYLANPVDSNVVVPTGMENNIAFAGIYQPSTSMKSMNPVSPKLNGGADVANRGWLIEALISAYNAIYEDTVHPQNSIEISSAANPRSAHMMPELNFRDYLKNLGRNAGRHMGARPVTEYSAISYPVMGVARGSLGSHPAEGAGWNFQNGIGK